MREAAVRVTPISYVAVSVHWPLDVPNLNVHTRTAGKELDISDSPTVTLLDIPHGPNSCSTPPCRIPSQSNIE